MERAILFGPFGFLGFSLCKELLYEGVQVNGLLFEGMMNDPFIEEKRMEIGRNANFIEKSKEELASESYESESFVSIIVPIYDFFMKKQETEIINDCSLCDFFQQHPPENSSVTFLLPEQYRTEQHETIKVNELLHFLRKNGYSCTEVYLPTLYGPWQPEEYLFQQLLSQENEYPPLPPLYDRESVVDAIFIDDAARAVVQLLKEPEGRFLISSDSANTWFKGLEYLVEDEKLVTEFESCIVAENEKSNDTDEVDTIYIKNPMEISEGLQLQRKNYQFWMKTK